MLRGCRLVSRESAPKDSPTPPFLLSPSVLIVTGIALILGLVATKMLSAQKRREARDEQLLADAVAADRHIPPSLYPVIDPKTCIGCLACLRACPEGDILGVVHGKARLINATNCIGHGKCAVECPTGAIKLVFGTAERGVDLPEVDEFFQSSRPGVHVVGELGGMGLIRNAITQGIQVAEHLAAALRSTSRPDLTDVAIVGAGPAGLATALGCRAAGLSVEILEQNSFGGTIAQYPRQKVVMTERVRLPIYGKFGKPLISKEELLSTWRKAVDKSRLSIRERVKVEGLEGSDGGFALQTNRGVLRARKVVLATGRRGSPRKLGVPGEQLSKVSYSLVDPEQYQGCCVLVVGGGDSALEAAAQLAEQSNAEVVISYRQQQFSKCREANRQKIQGLIRRRRVYALMPSVVKEIRDKEVIIEFGGKARRLPNDYTLVLIGGELPLEMLRRMQIGLRRHHGTAPDEVSGPACATPKKSARAREEAKNRRLGRALFLLGAAIIAALAYLGWDYYWLPPLERLRSPLHPAFKPAGTWGHGIGIGATAVMLSNFLYALRKRWSFLQGAAPLKRWLTFHMFVGVLSPALIAFHAAFQSNNLLATGTAAAVASVVLTGLIGRFIYGLVPTQEGHAVALAELAERLDQLKATARPMVANLPKGRRALEALDDDAADRQSTSLLLLFLKMPWLALRSRLRLRGIRRLFPNRAEYRDFKKVYLDLARLRTQVRFYGSLRRLLSGWRVFHILMAILLVVMIAMHITVSFYLGYRWIFSVNAG